MVDRQAITLDAAFAAGGGETMAAPDWQRSRVPVDYAGRADMSGVDSPEDIDRAEALIARHGELLPARGQTVG